MSATVAERCSILPLGNSEEDFFSFFLNIFWPRTQTASVATSCVLITISLTNSSCGQHSNEVAGIQRADFNLHLILILGEFCALEPTKDAQFLAWMASPTMLRCQLNKWRRSAAMLSSDSQFRFSQGSIHLSRVSLIAFEINFLQI